MAAVTADYDYITGDYPDEGLCNLDPNPAEVITQACIHTIICAFGLIGNALVIITYTCYRKAKSLTDVYLLNVAVADLIFVVALPFIIYNETHGWPMGPVACKFLRSSYSINIYSGMLLLACVSRDCYVAVVQARRSFGARSHAMRFSRLVCAAVWLSAAAVTLPTLIYTERLEERRLGPEPVLVTFQLSFSQDEMAKLVKVLLPSLQMTAGFLLVMPLCHSSVVVVLLRAQSSQRQKAVRVVLAVVWVFILCHLPYNVALLSHTLSLFQERCCEAEKVKLQVLGVSRSVAYLHCCLNPVLYAFIGVKFRSHFHQILLDVWRVSRAPLQGPPVSRRHQQHVVVQRVRRRRRVRIRIRISSRCSNCSVSD
ncbi:C-C chemokine receptor type 6 [Brachionichthys hirsutus]|uniref:C-C chemokine receptor type 6 n=1 Tax=Brachionichthys hirsutus TaxID=412623 RepID=UPI0036050DDE